MEKRIEPYAHVKDLDLLCKDVVPTCGRCQQVRNLHHSTTSAPINEPDRNYDQPTSHWHLDHWGPVETNSGKRYIWKATCAFTRYSVTGLSASNTAMSAYNFLNEKVIDVYGVPLKIYTDGGGDSSSKVVDKLNAVLQIKHILTSPYNAKTNAIAVRGWRWMKDYIHKNTSNFKDMPSMLATMTFAYNITFNINLGCIPFFARHGYNPDTDALHRIPDKAPRKVKIKSNPDYAALNQQLDRLRVFAICRLSLRQHLDQALEARNKGNKHKQNVQIGDLVLLKVPDADIGRIPGVSRKMVPEYTPSLDGRPFKALLVDNS